MKVKLLLTALRNWKPILIGLLLAIGLVGGFFYFAISGVVGAVVSVFSFGGNTDLPAVYKDISEDTGVPIETLAVYDAIKTHNSFNDVTKKTIKRSAEEFIYYVNVCREVTTTTTVNGKTETTSETVCEDEKRYKTIEEILLEEGYDQQTVDYALYLQSNMHLILNGFEPGEGGSGGGVVDIDPEVIKNNTFIWPAPTISRISDVYSDRINPVTGEREFHKGLDISNRNYGEPVVATADGYVDGWNDDSNSSCGKWIVLQHEDGYSSRYCHMQKLAIDAKNSDGVATSVKKGDVIGYVGSTGQSTGPHLHFEIRLNGVFKNPLPYIEKSRPKG